MSRSSMPVPAPLRRPRLEPPRRRRRLRAPTTPSAPEPKDECTPVGVEFEKRARPKLKECYAVGKKKDPNLQGTVKLSVDIDIYGKVKTIKIVEKTLPEPVAQCMLKVIKSTPLTEASKCPGKSLTIPVTFPTPHSQCWRFTSPGMFGCWSSSFFSGACLRTNGCFMR